MKGEYKAWAGMSRAQEVENSSLMVSWAITTLRNLGGEQGVDFFWSGGRLTITNPVLRTAYLEQTDGLNRTVVQHYLEP